MTTRKRNEFLDIPSDDDDEEGSEVGYDSEAAEDTKGRIQKRRRVASGEDGLRSDDEDKDEEEENDDDEQQQHKQQHEGQQTQSTPTSTITTPAPNININTSKTATSKDEKKKTKTKQKAEKLEKSKNKTGVIYLSSLPPYLKPSALKSMLEARSFAPITKVFLTPATPPPGASGSGKRVTSNKRKTYTDGWVEFASKKTAKICAETLNASIVGGKKGGWYHDDVWNMKYLRGFKWGDLMEQVQRERSEREAKRRVEDSRARKEEKLFVSGVEKGKVLEGMQRKREEKDQRKKKIKGDGEGDDAAPKQEDDEAHGSAKAMDLQQGPKVPVRRLFKQNEIKTRSMAGDGDAENARLADDTKRVLGKIF